MRLRGGSRGPGRFLRPFRYPARWASLLASVVPVALVFPGLSLSYLAWIALVPGLVLFASALLRPGERAWSRFGLALIALPATWLIPEWARSYQGLGGPWDLYGASQWQHPAVLALAAVGGVWLVSVALVIANVAVTFAVLNWRRVPLVAGGLAALVAAAGSGPLAFALTPPFPVARTVTVAMVQPGVVDNAA